MSNPLTPNKMAGVIILSGHFIRYTLLVDINCRSEVSCLLDSSNKKTTISLNAKFMLGNPGTCHFLWMPLQTNNLSTPLKIKHTLIYPSNTGHPAGQCALPHHKQCSGTTPRTSQRAQGINLASICPVSKFD